MKESDIRRLGDLARISLDDAMVASIGESFTQILSYVDQIRELASDKAEEAHHLINVTKDDSQAAGFSRDILLDDMPEREGDYLKVRKIL